MRIAAGPTSTQGHSHSPSTRPHVPNVTRRRMARAHASVTDEQEGTTRHTRSVWHSDPVPRFEAFPALRYAGSADLDEVTAPPYDVQTSEQTRALAERSPHNVVAIDVPAVVHEGADDVYAVAADTLSRWVAEGVLVADHQPSLTILRMRFTDQSGEERDLASVVGLLEVVDEGAGGVLAHERTTPKASTDRLDLTRATRANLSPVWGLSMATGLTEMLQEPGELVGRVDVDGVTHLAERVTDPQRIASITELVGSDEVLIADGHHRYAVARAFRDEKGAAGGSGLTLASVGELVPEQLSVRAIHRLYGGADHGSVREALAEYFDLTDAPIPSLAMLSDLVDKGVLALIGPDGSAEWLTPKEGAFDGVRSLDGAWLEHALAGLASESELATTYEHDMGELVEAIVSGRAHSGVLIRPVSIEEIERTARERLLMPPKSTFFTPKPITGLVLRSIE